ncbi:MAG: enoyl-CoA hydratase-related protein [Pseudomonadota bacterium]
MDAAQTPSRETSSPHVLIRDDGHIRRIVLNRPAQRNLLTPEMIAALSEALDTGAKVIVIASDGPAFCAGHDMKGMAAHHGDADGGRAYFAALFADCGAMMEKIARIPQPVIAEVHAPAVAAGCQLVAACDLAVAADTAKFGTTGVTFGLYCSTPAVPLTRTVAAKHAAEMLMTGDLVDAAHAQAIGLINRSVPAEKLTEETMALAGRIARHSGAVLSLGKRSVAQTTPMGLGDAYAAAADAMVENLLLADGREGLAAFRDKRPALWQDWRRSDKRDFWNERYRQNPDAFGDAPSAFLAEVRSSLTGTRAFAAADGQGRNAIYLAQQGFDVTLNDLSEVAAEQAASNAKARGAHLTISVANLLDAPPPPLSYDVVTAIFLHLPDGMRQRVHALLAEAVAPGGALVVEAFHKGQASLKQKHGSGGPSDPTMLYSKDLLTHDFSPHGLVPERVEELEVDLEEGRFHTGRAAVVRGLFRRAP